MKVKPNDDYRLLATEIRLDKEKIYDASPAENLPLCEELGLIFVEEVLLRRGEYEIIES